MERYSAALSGASPAASNPSAVRSQFLRIIILVLTATLISSQLSTIIALELPSASTKHVDFDLLSSSSGSSIANNTRDLEAFSSNSKQIVDHKSSRHHHRERSRVSRYVRGALGLDRGPQQLQQKKGSGAGKGSVRARHINLRRLSQNSGCMSNPTMCATVPGWTTAANASTCCSTTGFCTDIMFDGFNCGDCGQPCDFGYMCCSAVCVPMGTDPNNCGQCGKVCAGRVCTFGFCNY